jgi:proline dehydrogenase
MRHGFARRFVAGETLDEAMAASVELWRAGRRVVLNLLGENVSTPDEALGARDSYLAALRALDGANADGIAADISIKLTQLGLDFDRDACVAHTREIASFARQHGRGIEIDMESTAYTERTLEIYEIVQREHGNVGLAIQSYLRRSGADIERLSTLGNSTRRVKIRLVKGAYHEPASAAFQKKSEVDDNYRKLLDRLLQPMNGFYAAIATHDPTLVNYASELIRQRGLSNDNYEFQMIYGIRRDLQEQVHSQGHALRVYVPFGTAWVPYFMRRLSERPANLWFVLRSLLAERKTKH